MKSLKYGKLANVVLMAATLYLTGAQVALAGFPMGKAVTMGGEPVFTISSPSCGYTSQHRAQLAQDNLDNALATAPGCSPSLVTSERVNGQLAVLLNGHLIATADMASAQAEGLSVDQLATRWADGIRSFLADKERGQNYRDTLVGLHFIQASTVYVERRLYVPGGTSLPVIFNSSLSSESLTPGQNVTATVSRAVKIGDEFMVPSGSVVSGKVVENQAHELTISLTDLKTPSGTDTPIDAFLAKNFVLVSDTPHPVCTLSMPAGLTTYGRVPAMVAIGISENENAAERLAFVPGSNFQIESGQEVSVIFNQATPIAVLERGLSM
jgi:hypothetical protein